MDLLRKYEQVTSALFPPPEIQRELNRTVAVHLRHMLAAFALLYFSLALTELPWIDPKGEQGLLIFDLFAVAFFLSFRAFLSAKGPISHFSHPSAAAVIGFLVIGCLNYVRIRQNPMLIEPVILLLGIAGFILLSTRWFIAVVLGILAAWPLGLMLIFGSYNWMAVGLPAWGFSIFSALVFILRMQTMVKLEVLRRQAQDHRDKLQDALETAHRELEERRRTETALESARLTYRIVSELTNDLILTMDSRGRVTYCNDRARHLLGSSLDFSTDSGLRGFLHPEEIQIAQGAFKQIVQEGRVVREVLFRLQSSEGWRLIEWSGSPVISSDGNRVGVQCVGRDVTEQHEAVCALKESEARWKLLVDMAPDFIVQVDRDLRISYINRVGEDYDGPEVVGAYSPDLIGEYGPMVRVMLEKVFATGENAEFEFPYQASKGRQWYLVRVAPLKKDDVVASLMVVVTDVTQSKNAEEAVRESEARYRLLAEHVSDVIWTSDLNLRFTFVSPSAQSVFGYTSQELEKINVTNILTAESLRKAHEVLRVELENEKRGDVPDKDRVTTLELESVRKDGTRFWTEIRVSFLRDKQRRATGILGVTREITERKKAEEELRRSEERYRLLAENATDFIWTSDLNFNFTFLSPSGLRMMGYLPEEAATLRADQLATPDSFRRATEAFLEELALENDPLADLHRTRTLELESIRKDGSTFWTEVKVTFLRDREGKPTGIVGVSRDITERRQAEEVKERLENQLLQSQKLEAIGTLAGGIAHDFNNLLAAILGYASMMKGKSHPEDEFFKGCDVIERAAERGRELTQQLLGFARKGKLQNTVVDINRTIQEVVNLLSRTINKSVQIREELAHEPVLVKGDPSQMQQVLLNLAVNANDAMSSNDGTLTFKTAIADLGEEECAGRPGLKPGRHAIFSVADTGSGIDDAIVPRIFEPFFTTKEQGKGSGMGLAMVYGIVKNHMGEIEVDSIPGQGTTFRVFLPLIEGGAITTPVPDAGEPRRGQGRVLVVDDEEIVRQMVSDMLIHLGYDVVTASDGQEAVDFYKAHGMGIDLVLLDMIMPRMGGRDCFRQLKQLNPGVRAVLSTGYSRDETAQEILEEGMLDFIQKPYRIGRLSEVVQKAIDLTN